jgi:nitroreductase
MVKLNFRTLINLLATPLEYCFDTLRAFRWSKASPLCPIDKQLHYDILLLAHTVEKGLSVSNPREQFGVEKITLLLSFLAGYKLEYGQFPMEKSYGCLLAYVNWHKSIGVDLGEFGSSIQVFLNRCLALDLEPKGGVKLIANGSHLINTGYELALNSRFSCRRFEPLVVPQDLITRISSVAARTPSQCNRQSSRVHYYSDRDEIDKLLRLQGGAEGFRESVFNLLVITSEMSAWSGVKARSQSYVDGALTSMQVLNACQSLGLGACPLNLAVTNRRESLICNAGGISNGERLIMMIAFGFPEKIDLSVARSERMQIDKIMVRH